MMERGFGSLIGASVGFVLLRGPVGAVVGSLAGYAIQQKLRRLRGGAHAISPIEVHQQLSYLVRLLVSVGQVDGPIQARRRAAVRSYFERDARLPKLALVAVDQLVSAHASGATISPAKAAAALVGLDPRERIHAIFVCHRVALAEGPMSDAATRAIREAADAIGLSAQDLEAVRSWFLTGASAAHDSDYQTLGVKAGASDFDIHSRYKQAVKESHPDRFHTQGPDAARAAEERFKAVKAAYERLRSGDRPKMGPRVSLCPNCRTFTAADEALCIRCGETKHEEKAGTRRMRCPLCNQHNSLPKSDVDSLVRCGNCKAILIR